MNISNLMLRKSIAHVHISTQIK
uniref:Uncharacterized protein n=1 Tax=Rhizophora mucronata TaxID=61149 RepID=A0A2P2MWG0_RHIMU